MSKESSKKERSKSFYNKKIEAVHIGQSLVIDSN